MQKWKFLPSKTFFEKFKVRSECSKKANYAKWRLIYITRQAKFQIKYNALFFRFTVDEGIKRGIITTSEILEFIRLSSVFEVANITVSESAIGYYLEAYYLAFIHIIIPQQEEGVRNLAETNGGNVLIAKGDTYMLKTFDIWSMTL